MGGPSNEHTISLQTGENVYRAINREKYRPHKLVLGKDYKLTSNGTDSNFPNHLKNYDVIFNALHGSFGEDGLIQTMLNHLGVKFTGSDSSASWLGMDKWLSWEIFKKNRLPVPKTVLANKLTSLGQFSIPAILKPRRGGSSLGVKLINSKKELSKNLQDLLIQEYLIGREFTCAVVQTKNKLLALPVIEIKLVGRRTFFDYAAKYMPGLAQEIVPAQIENKIAKKIKTLAIKAHELLNCSGYSRSDFILKGDTPYILEINTLPGLTSNSLLPKAAMAAGISFEDLINEIILGQIV